MNNLHRELAPISDAAWAQIEEEASRTLKRYLAARRVVDVVLHRLGLELPVERHVVVRGGIGKRQARRESRRRPGYRRRDPPATIAAARALRRPKRVLA